MREPYPIPAQHLMQNTRYATSAPTVKASVWDVIWLMWQEGFGRILTDSEIKRLCSLPESQWNRYETDLKAILVEVIPLLQAKWTALSGRHKEIQHYAALAREAHKKKRIASKVADKQANLLAEKEIPHPAFIPINESQSFNTGMSDHSQRHRILATPKNPKATFTEK